MPDSAPCDVPEGPTPIVLGMKVGDPVTREDLQSLGLYLAGTRALIEAYAACERARATSRGSSGLSQLPDEAPAAP